MNEHQKALARNLMARIVETNQMAVATAVTASMLEAMTFGGKDGKDGERIIKDKMTHDMAREITKKAAIAWRDDRKELTRVYTAVVYVLPPEAIAEFALACYADGVASTKVTL